VATGFIFDIETAYTMELLYSGETAVCLLCSGAVWGKSATVADVLATELTPVNGYTRASQAIGNPAWENTDRRTTAPIPNANFTAVGGNFTFETVVLMIGASTVPSKLITACNPATNTFTVAGGHNLSVNDRILITTDSPGVNPGGVSAGTLYYAIVDSATEFRISATAGGSAIDVTDAGSIGTHPTRLRYGNGRIVGAYRRSAPRTVFAGETLPVPFTLANFNGGFGRGV